MLNSRGCNFHNYRLGILIPGLNMGTEVGLRLVSHPIGDKLGTDFRGFN